MLAFMVVLRSGQRFTIRAAEMRLNYDRCLELLSPDTDLNSQRQVVAMFDANEVIAVVAREHLVSEETAAPPVRCGCGPARRHRTSIRFRFDLTFRNVYICIVSLGGVAIVGILWPTSTKA